MLKPSFRFFIVPLGAVATLATLSAQNIQPRAQREQADDQQHRDEGAGGTPTLAPGAGMRLHADSPSVVERALSVP